MIFGIIESLMRIGLVNKTVCINFDASIDVYESVSSSRDSITLLGTKNWRMHLLIELETHDHRSYQLRNI